MVREVRNRKRAILIIIFRGHDLEIESEDDLLKMWVSRLQRLGMDNVPGPLVIGAVAEEGPRIGQSCDRIHDNMKDLDLRWRIS